MLILILVFISQSSCRPTDDSMAANESAKHEKLLYVTNLPGNFEIYLWDIQKEERTNLTRNLADDLDPNWNKNAQQIVFSSNRDGNFEIYTMDMLGENVRRLTTNDGIDGSPKWSPDGKRIAFVSERGKNDSTPVGIGRAHGSSQIYMMNSDGSNRTRLSKDDDIYYELSWSPDGKKLAACVSSSRGHGAYSPLKIAIFDVEKKQTKRFDYYFSHDCDPAWSDSSETLAFSSERDGGSSLYTVDLKDNSLTRLPLDMKAAIEPDWLPGSEDILFAGMRNKVYDIFSINLRTNMIRPVLEDQFIKIQPQIIYVDP